MLHRLRSRSVKRWQHAAARLKNGWIGSSGRRIKLSSVRGARASGNGAPTTWNENGRGQGMSQGEGPTHGFIESRHGWTQHGKRYASSTVMSERRPSPKRWMKWEDPMRRFCAVRALPQWTDIAQDRDIWEQLQVEFSVWTAGSSDKPALGKLCFRFCLAFVHFVCNVLTCVEKPNKRASRVAFA